MSMQRIFRDLSFEDAVSFKRFLLQKQNYVLHAGETFVNFAALTRVMMSLMFPRIPLTC